MSSSVSKENTTLGALFKGIPPFVVLALCIGLFRRLVTKSFSSVAQTLKCKPGNKSKNKIENPKDTALCTSLFLGGGRLKVKLIHAIDLIAASLLTQLETQIEQRPARMSAVVATRRDGLGISCNISVGERVGDTITNNNGKLRAGGDARR